MRRILFFNLTLLLSLQLFGQNDIESKLKKEFWDQASAEFKSTAVPDKWKNESAVILAADYEYILDFKTAMATLHVEKLNIHLRVKVQDKAAVTDFSDLSFNEKTVRSNIFGRASSYHVVGVKVVKPDGTQKEVNLKDAVKTDVTSSKDLKIPIPNLEPGDIIDYFIAIKSESAVPPDFTDDILLEGKYPAVINRYKISIPHQFFFTNASYNGAPEFMKEVIKNDEIYSLTNKMQEKAPELRWDYPYRSAPNVRYRIYRSANEVSPDTRVDNLLDNSFLYNASDIGYLEDFLDMNFKKEKDTKKIATELFYALRNPIYKECYFGADQSDPIGSGYATNEFFLLMNKYLKSKKIDHEIILLPYRSYGETSDLYDLSACDFVLKIKTTPALYFARPQPFRLPGEMPYLVEGVEGISHKGGSPHIQISTTDQNSERTTFNVSFAPGDLSKLNVKRNIVAKGHVKSQHQYNVVTNYDYLKSYDQPKYLAESSRKVGAIIKKYVEEKKKLEQRMAQDYQERDTRIKEKIEGDMNGKLSDYKMALKSIGMWENAPDIEYDDEFSLEGLTKKAGPNQILEIGKLIGGQTEIEEKQMTRTRDIYMDYPRSFTEEITLNIPAGYIVEGLENLNKSVVTEAGGFVSSSEIKGNQLIVKAQKFYNGNHYKASEWTKITGFLASAVEFYNAKILLKKQ